MRCQHARGYDLKILILIRQRSFLSKSKSLFVLSHLVFVNWNLWRLQGRGLNKNEVWITNKFSGQPQERLFKVVIAFSTDIVILQVLLSVESDLLWFHLSIFHIDFVSAQNNRNSFTNSDEISVPVWNILVGHSGGNIEHDDCSLSLNVVTISESTEFFLSSSVPNIESNRSTISVKSQRMHFNSQSCNVFLFKFTSKMSFNKSSFSCSTITNKN
mmetsp:Transcript_11469/g.15919  ORF Transcript_11469/g.15919 Transcript_11469/m.15919 type:complete len:215 (+) Transcript_11469:3515-4159(+)